MPFTRATRRLAAWLTMLAMVFGAFAPAVAHAIVASKGGPDWVQVCSASGMVWVQIDDGGAVHGAGESGEKSLADAPRHCPLFNLHGTAGLPPAPLQALALAPRAGQPPAPEPPVPAAAFWPASQSRAPPQV
ncbi:DUF2946 family protein [Hydrogenophaga laconesensis]|uniref:DUF2946 domain-containing protein n=1 Tax=Hydrogenophaga laconesensis TaxID=1805971 RepID=A0ABU1VBU9_9BURK|nr:DUF2946 family protein [Hydrogenophaga laconesensis]MDR7094961.1 hypothetical protein [Hydrogenophaga laconesensis]